VMPRSFDQDYHHLERHGSVKTSRHGLLKEAISPIQGEDLDKTMKMMGEGVSPDEIVKSDVGTTDNDGILVVNDGTPFTVNFPDISPDEPVDWQINIGKSESDPNDREEAEGYLRKIREFAMQYGLKADAEMPTQAFHGQGTYKQDAEISIALHVFMETSRNIEKFLHALGKQLPKEYCFAVKPDPTTFTLFDNPSHPDNDPPPPPFPDDSGTEVRP